MLSWTKKIIQNLAQKIKEGTKFFIGHNEDNSHENRSAVGEVLTSFIKDIKGKLSNVIIGYFPESEKVNNLDVCSMEAEIGTDENNNVVNIDNVSGIALGSSNEDSPAFPGARRLSMVQCFAKEKIEPENKKPGEGDKQMTFEDIKKAIREMNVHPWQIFSLEDMKNDRVFGKVFDDNTALKKSTEELKTQYEELKTKNSEVEKTLNLGKSKQMLEDALKEGFTDKQVKFIENRFNPESLDEVNKENINKYIENAKKEFADTARLFGVEGNSNVDNNNNASNNENKTPEEEALELMGVKE